MEQKAASYGIPFHRLRLRGDGDVRGVFLLRKLFRKFRPDAVILTKMKEYWLGGIAAKLSGVDKTYFRMGIDRPVQRNIKYKLLLGKICDMFIVNAESVRDTLLEAPFIQPERISIVKNGIATEKAGDADPSLMSSLGVQPGSTVVGATGRLAKQKGFDVLIRAFKTIQHECPDASLVIAGEGHERPDLQRLIHGLDLSKSVLMPGFVEDMTSFYNGLALFALPSRFEGMPNVVLEAMAAGVPVVASDVSGVSELIKDRRTGHLVPAEDPEQLAARIVEVLDSEEQRKALAERALHLVETDYSVDRMLNDLEKVLVENHRHVRPKRISAPPAPKPFVASPPRKQMR
jgi:glycosyltransferase involved in cell wall biosynthesis